MSHVVFRIIQGNMRMRRSMVESLNSVGKPFIRVVEGLQDEYRDLASLMLCLLMQTKQV